MSQPSKSFRHVLAAAALALAAGPVAAASYTWSSGLFNPGVTAPGALPAGDTLNIQPGANKQFFNVSFSNDGSVLWAAGAGSDVLYLSSGASVVNNGLWDDQGANLLLTGDGAGGTFTNNGTYLKSGAGSSFLVPTVLTNNGTIDVRQGQLTLQNNTVNSGTVTGDGRLVVGGGTGLTNNGMLAPGSVGAGTLTLNGIYRQSASGSFAVDLGSTSSFDQLVGISGGYFLDGTLALNCLGACSFAVGDSVTIIDGGGTLSGSFSNVTLSGFGSGAFDVVYDVPTARVSLLVTEAVSPIPEPASWALFAAGLAALGRLSAGARRRRA